MLIYIVYGNISKVSSLFTIRKDANVLSKKTPFYVFRDYEKSCDHGFILSVLA